MIVRKRINIYRDPTPEEIAELDRAAQMPIPEDSDIPPLTKEQLAQFHRVSDEHNYARRKGTVTLRLSPAAIKRAKSLGKGYTSVLSRILEAALADPETIEKYL